MIKNLLKVLIPSFLIFIGFFCFVASVGLIENRQWAGNLTGMHHSSVAMGDFNNDNKTDLILVGCTAGAVTSCTSIGAYVYTNNGMTLTHNLSWSQNLTAVGRSSIAIGDIDNDGDLDIIIAGSSDYSTADITRVYINNGTSLVANQNWQQNISNANVYGGSVALGDVNNDGRIDIAISGADNSGYEGIYINNGSSFNKDYTWTPPSFPNGGKSLGLMALSWVDLDGDSRLDLVVMGSYSTTFYTNIYTNNGTSLVQNTSWEQNIALSLGWPSIAFGDYDLDGDMDMGYIGTRVGDRFYIYNNEKNNFSSNQTSSGDNLAGYFDGALAFGDYDNDGDLDIVAMGKESGRNRIYLNNNTLFQIDTNVGSPFQSDNIQQGSLLWNDIDSDGDIDLISLGKIGDTFTMNATIYINNASLTTNNSIPYPPSTFQNYTIANGNVFLGWNNGSDNETTSLGLYYNLRIGTTNGGNDIVSGVFGASSRPTQGQFGNMMQRRNISLSGSRFSVGTTYFWSVQTIDTGLAKSAWSAEQTFTLTSDFTPPTVTLYAPSGVTNQTLNIVFNATVYDDYNLTNVSLYGNWSGGWHVNLTNASGINNTDYIFKANLTEGEWLFGIRACDVTSNCRGVNGTFRIDVTYPVVVLVSPANGTSQTSSNSVTFTYNVSDVAINNCTLYLNGAVNESDSTITSNGSSQTFTENVPNGNYNWTIRCADAANNVNVSGNFSLTVDSTMPVITINAPGNALVTNLTGIVFNATVYDDVSLINVSLYGNWTGGWHKNQTNSSGINNTDYIFRLNLTEGEWLWEIRVCDNSNNCNGTNQTFRIDITYPVVALVSPANGMSQTSSNSVTFTYNVSDVAINNCTLYLNGIANESDSTITSNGSSQTFAENVPNGNYNWSVRCADAANNINTTTNFSLTVSYTPDTTPPSTSSGGGGGGGGGGGSIASAVTTVTRIIAAITAGNNLIEFAESEKASVGIEEIMLNAAAAASNVKLTIEKLVAMPVGIASFPAGEVYTYLQFNKTVLKDEDVKEAKIKFNVLKSWVLIKGADPEKVKLNRYR